MGNFCTRETKEKTKTSVEAISVTDSEIFAKSASDREPPAETPKEKRGQSTRRSPPRVPALDPEDHAVLKSWIQQKKKASAVAATNTKRAGAATAKIAGAAASSRGCTVEEEAAVMIQSAFRSYLARKALRALKGLVKVQALVRGHLVRKKTTTTIQRMQSLATVQARARAQRTRMADESNSNIYQTPSRKSMDRKSRQSGYQEIDWGTDENIRIVEVDLVGSKSNRSTSSRKSFSGHPPQAAQTNRRGTTSSTPNRAYSKQQDLSLKPSPLVQSRPRAQSMRYDDYYFDTAKSSQQSSPRYSWSENPSYVQAYQRAGSYPGGQSKQERRDISLLMQAHVDSSSRAGSDQGFIDYYLDTEQSSPRASSTMSKPEYPSAYAENTEPPRVKKLDRSLSAPKTRAGSVTGVSSRKKAAQQAGLRLDSNVDPWLAKLARVSGADKKRNHGSSGTSHTNNVHGRSRSAWKI